MKWKMDKESCFCSNNKARKRKRKKGKKRKMDSVLVFSYLWPLCVSFVSFVSCCCCCVFGCPKAIAAAPVISRALAV